MLADRTSGTFNIVAFIALFPGAFLYQVGVATNTIPAFAGGYFGIACLAMLLVLAGRYAKRLTTTMRMPVFDAAYFGFLGYFAAVALSFALVNGDDRLLGWHLGAVCQALCVFLLFKGLPDITPRHTRCLWLCVMIMTTCIFYFMSNGAFSLKTLSGGNPNVSTYQGFALYYLVTAMLAIAKTERRHLRLSVYPCLCVALYVNGARSELVGFLIFICMFEVLSTKQKLAWAFALFSFAAVIGLTAQSWQALLPENRVARLTTLNEDTSYQVRNNILHAGLSKISDNVLMGSYGDYEKGYYIHGILSVWQDLGLIGLLYYCGLIAVPLTTASMALIRHRGNDADQAFVISALVACLILLIFAKYFTYLLLPAVLGYHAAQKCGR